MVMITVDGVQLPTPSSFSWGQQDVSANGAGRTEDARMHKNLVAKKIKISLSWSGKSWQETSQILQAFQPEYINVTYPDMLTGKYETKEFYSGDKSAPVKIWTAGNKVIESISFDIIER